jgi:hypothetical protein
MVDSALTKLSLGSLTSVTENLTLPATGIHATTISWQSSNTAVLANNGTVNRPASGQPNAHMTLTATVSKYFISKSISFNVTVLSQLSDAQSVSIDSEELILNGNLQNLRSNISLPLNGKEGSQIHWTSGDQTFLSNTGVILKRYPKGEGNKKVTLTATITKGSATSTKNFDIYIAEDEGYSAYLFAYFYRKQYRSGSHTFCSERRRACVQSPERRSTGYCFIGHKSHRRRARSAHSAW